MIASAMAVTCGRYISELGACNFLASEIKHIPATKPYIMGGHHALEEVLPRIEPSLKNEKLDYTVAFFEGYCSYNNAAKHAEQAKDAGCDCIIAIGGGKCIDTGKVISKLTGLPIGNIPTSLATCVACTNLAITYEDSGAYSGPCEPDRTIDFVLADHEVLANTPERYIASGIADSLAKYPEIHFSQRGTYNCRETNDSSEQCAHSLAICTWNLLMANGRQAYSDNKKHIISNEFTSIINTNLIQTAVISGLSGGSRQLALAHALYNNSTTVFPEVWRTYLHGEIVSVGILLQEYYNDAPEDEIQQYLSIARDLKVPVSLRDMGIQGTAQELDSMYNAIISDFDNFSNENAAKLRTSLERIVEIS